MRPPQRPPPLPLLLHLGHPERSFEIFLTPHLRSAMAMFGFVYAWYLMAVLLLELDSADLCVHFTHVEICLEFN